MNLYQETLTDHYRSPRNRGFLQEQNKHSYQGISFVSELHNPSCGDSVSWQGFIGAGKVTTIAFEGKGCVISQGTASMLSERVMGMSPEQIMALDAPFMRMFIGLELGPTRLRCALLPLEALQQAVAHHNSSISTHLEEL
jgi:nitrogen fixation NifU-like protein